MQQWMLGFRWHSPKSTKFNEELHERSIIDVWWNSQHRYLRFAIKEEW
jgi:hypothetical protein